MRRTLVALAASTLVGVLAAPATAAYENCPAGVSEVRGTSSPSRPLVEYLITNAAAKHGVPAALVRAVAWDASEWLQYLPDNTARASSDGACRVGVMGVPAAGREDAVRLAASAPYNVDEGVKLLRAAWDATQQVAPPDGYAADDPDVLENWYDTLCGYGACGASDAYARRIAGILHDPFRTVPQDARSILRPAGLTLPSDVDAAYAYPAAFQARHTATGGELVFYDAATGDVTKVVPARTHRASAPPVVSYPTRTTGPDWANVSCEGCSRWQLAEGTGLSGRAHWATTVTGAATSRVTWTGPARGYARVQVYVPALGAATLGRATYRVRPNDAWSPSEITVVVDQNAHKGKWVTLGQWHVSDGSTVTLTDAAAVAGRPIVADAVRYLGAPIIPVNVFRGDESDVTTLTYGQSARLWLQFNHGDYEAFPTQQLKVYRRTAGTTAWQMLGAWPTNSDGELSLTIRPSATSDYVAKWTSTDPNVFADGASRVYRVNVRPVVTMSMPNWIRPGQSLVVDAKVSPANTGETVYLQRFYGGMWRNVQARTLGTYGTARFVYSFPGNLGEMHSFRVYKPADRDHLYAVSESRAMWYET